MLTICLFQQVDFTAFKGARKASPEAVSLSGRRQARRTPASGSWTLETCTRRGRQTSVAKKLQVSGAHLGRARAFLYSASASASASTVFACPCLTPAPGVR